MNIITNIESELLKESVYLKLETQEDMDKLYAIFNDPRITDTLDLPQSRIRELLEEYITMYGVTKYTDKLMYGDNE